MQHAGMMIGLLIAAQCLATAQTGELPERDWRLGVRVGSCLVVKCQVFRGRIVTDSPRNGENVVVGVEEWLYGEPPAPESVRFLWSSPLRKGDDGSNGLTWKGEKIASHGAVLVVSSMERGFGISPGEAAWVTADERETRLIRELVEEARKFEGSPREVAEEVGSLIHKPNPALAGFCFTYLALSKTSIGPEIRSQSLLQLLVSSSVPSDSRSGIALWLTSDYYALPAAARQSIVDELAELGQQADSGSVRAALQGLTKIATIENDLASMIPPAALAKLAGAYEGLVKNGKMPRATPLEKGLGVQARLPAN